MRNRFARKRLIVRMVVPSCGFAVPHLLMIALSGGEAQVGSGVSALGARALRREKFEDGAMCRGGLVGLENVAGVRNQHEFSAGNFFGDQAGVRSRNKPV